MQIAFLCGSLEPGLDGVGDYTRRLAAEFLRKGHGVSIISIFDRHIIANFQGIQVEAALEIPVLRLAAADPWPSRIKAANNFLTRLGADWVSLQFVPFSFHDKGIESKLDDYLKEIWQGNHWHIMFHELWVGMETQASLKHKLLGFIQKRQIRSLLKTIRPLSVHTNTSVYKYQLNQLGFAADLLPLFPNILSTGKVTSAKNTLTEITLVLFGSIHEGGPVEAFGKEIAGFAKEHHKAIRLRLAGRNGKERGCWEQVFAKLNIPVEITGIQPVEEISTLLNNSTFGVSTTPIDLSEKSGSVAAMFSHYLPILTVSRPWTVKGFTRQPMNGITEYQKGNFENWILGNPKAGPFSDVTLISQTLIENLLDKQPNYGSS